VINYNKELAKEFSIDRKTIIVKIAPLTKYLNQSEKRSDLTQEDLEIIADVCNRL